MKFRSTLYGSGKIGDLVGRKGFDGQFVASKHVRHIHNPNTQAQQIVRMKMSTLTQMMGPLSGWIAAMFMRNSKRSAWAQAIKDNIKTAVTGTYPNFQVDFTLMKMANGKIDLPYSPNGTADGTTLTLTWADNSGMGDAMATDKVACLVYNPTKKQCIWSTNLAERSERTCTMTLPTMWTGDTVNVWMAMKRDAQTINGVSIKGGVSQSTFLASLPL